MREANIDEKYQVEKALKKIKEENLFDSVLKKNIFNEDNGAWLIINLSTWKAAEI